jgi:hypothetical protein
VKLNDVKNNFIPGIPYDIHWKVKWSRIENYEIDDKINDWKSMPSFIVGLGTVQTLKAN